MAVVLLQQWNSIRHFQTTILDCCKQSLKSAGLEEPAILQSLLTMVTLDHISTRQAFNEFLIGRKVPDLDALLLISLALVGSHATVVSPQSTR